MPRNFPVKETPPMKPGSDFCTSVACNERAANLQDEGLVWRERAEKAERERDELRAAAQDIAQFPERGADWLSRRATAALEETES